MLSGTNTIYNLVNLKHSNNKKFTSKVPFFLNVDFQATDGAIYLI